MNIEFYKGCSLGYYTFLGSKFIFKNDNNYNLYEKEHEAANKLMESIGLTYQYVVSTSQHPYAKVRQSSSSVRYIESVASNSIFLRVSPPPTLNLNLSLNL